MGKALLMRFARQSALRSPVFFGAKTTTNSIRNSNLQNESPVSNAVCTAKRPPVVPVPDQRDGCRQGLRQAISLRHISPRPRELCVSMVSTGVPRFDNHKAHTRHINGNVTMSAKCRNIVTFSHIRLVWAL